MSDLTGGGWVPGTSSVRLVPADHHLSELEEGVPTPTHRPFHVL